ncbi:hypothetical protein KEM60_00298 [Austwickia sp. TVS 96-490-7B]|nr:hypothetical protein [Austwickia sp. TVS 96-490-7B]
MVSGDLVFRDSKGELKLVADRVRTDDRVLSHERGGDVKFTVAGSR